MSAHEFIKRVGENDKMRGLPSMYLFVQSDLTSCPQYQKENN